MATNLKTTSYGVDSAKRFIYEVSNTGNNYYLCAGSPNPWFAGIVPTPYDDVYMTVVDVFRSLLFGKHITFQNVLPMIPNYPYAYGTTYAKYNDSDPLLFTKQFYTIVNADAYSHVFKCLDNNNDSPSTIPPNFADVDAVDDAYYTSDDYCWKYMFSVNSSTISQFATTTWFPYVANAAVAENAIAGSIDVIETLNSGNGYSNYLNGTFSISDIRLNGNDFIYAVNSQASPLQHFYDGGIIYITSDVLGDSAGQFRTITNYSVNSTTKFIQLNSPFINVPQNGAQYQIYPAVTLTGDGTESDTAVAWAVINASTNSIAYAQVLYRGSGYKSASASVQASTVVGVATNASMRPIFSPPGGHGANADRELGATAVGLSVVFNETEQNTIFANCDYQRLVLLKNPTFANVEIHFGSVSSIFESSETVNNVQIVELNATGQIAYNTTQLTASDADFTNQLNVGDNIIYTDQTNFQFNTVSSVVNSSTLYLITPCSWSSNTLSVFSANVISSGTLTGSGYNIINLDEVTAPISVGDYFIGETSGAFGTVSSIFRSGQQKTFSTFLATWQFTGTLTSGTFDLNEKVEKNLAENVANADLAAVAVNNSVLYVTNTYGIMVIGDTVTGNASGATFNITGMWPPEITFESGSVDYIENMSAISRNLTRSESFKLILQF